MSGVDRPLIDDPFYNFAVNRLIERVKRGELGEALSATPERLAQLVMTEGVADVAQEFARDMIRHRKSLRRRERGMVSVFQRRLHNTWGEGLDRLWLLWELVQESGNRFSSQERAAASESNDLVFEALGRLHGRGCLISREILTLLDAGLSSGAHARWRALHEVAATAFFIKAHGKDTAERYLLHGRATRHAAAVEHNRFIARLNEEPIPDDNVERLRVLRDELRKRFGPCYHRDNGWAAAALGIPCDLSHEKEPRCRVSFVQIERGAGLDHLRPYYRMASHPTHATAHGLERTLGAPDDPNVMMIGPSDAGLADPGDHMALSLMQVTVALLTHRPNIERLTVLQGLRQIRDDAVDELMKSNALSERRRRSGTRQWGWQDAVLRRRPR